MSEVHVLPLRDVVEHEVPGGIEGHDDGSRGWLAIETDEDADETACPCGPRTELVNEPGVPDGWLVVHHSLDGREARE